MHFHMHFDISESVFYNYNLLKTWLPSCVALFMTNTYEMALDWLLLIVTADFVIIAVVLNQKIIYRLLLDSMTMYGFPNVYVMDAALFDWMCLKSVGNIHIASKEQYDLTTMVWTGILFSNI